MRRLLTGFILAIMLGGVVSAAGKRVGASQHPPRYLPNAFDGAIVQSDNPVDGRTWSVWSYRNGGEFDLALSMRTAPGVWSEPLLIGLDDGLDQQQPAISVDSRGATYVAYADGTGAIRLTVLQPGATRWSAPITIAEGTNQLSNPSLMVVGSTMIVGYRDGDGVSLRTLPLLPPDLGGNEVRSIYDGPDPTTGYTDDDEKDESSSRDEPTFSTLSTNGGVSIKPVGAGTTHNED
jgi:hypothetical protein